MKKTWIALSLSALLLAASYAGAQCTDPGALTNQNQGQGQDQTMYGGQQSLETNSYSSPIPRSWPVPMPTPSPPQHAGYWGVITPDWTFQKVLDIARFKQLWTPGDIDSLCRNKAVKDGRNKGKIEIQKSIFSNFGTSDGIAVVTVEAPQNIEEMARFRRNFVQIGSIIGKGENGADSEQVMGEVMRHARLAGATLMIASNEGAQLILDSKSRYFAIGVSPSIMSGGLGSVSAGGASMGFGRGKSSVRYNAAPWQQWKLFARGVETYNDIAKLWRTPATPVLKRPVPGPGASQVPAGAGGIGEVSGAGGAKAAPRPLEPSMTGSQR